MNSGYKLQQIDDNKQKHEYEKGHKCKRGLLGKGKDVALIIPPNTRWTQKASSSNKDNLRETDTNANKQMQRATEHTKRAHKQGYKW